MQDFPPPKVKRLQLVNAPDPTGENDRQRAGSASLDHSADRPKHNIIGLNCVTDFHRHHSLEKKVFSGGSWHVRTSCKRQITQFRLC